MSQDESKSRTTYHVVPPELDGAPLDRAVRTLFETTWGQARRWIKKRKISLNGRSVTYELRRVHTGDEVLLDPEARRPLREHDLNPSTVVHLDRQVVVVAKPSGISTVPYDEEDTEVALVHQVQRFLAKRSGPRPKKRRSAMPRVMVVHRLDRGTSGLMVFARTYSSQQRLADQFREHTVRRRYLALAHGRVRPGTIESHLMDDRGDGLRGSSERSPDPKIRGTLRGKVAVTHLELKEALGGDRASLLICRLETGRTNQIRIHLSEANHPIVGETLYLRDYRGEVIESPRLMLHAFEIGFVHPVTGETLRFVQPTPDRMERMITSLRSTGQSRSH